MPRPRTYNRNSRKPMRKRNNNKKKLISKRKVYSRNYKRNTARILAPIAEGRKVTFTNTASPVYMGEIPDTENWQVIIPETWLQMYRENFLDTLPKQPSSQGFDGKTIFSRFLNQKVKIKFETIQHYNIPADMHVCFGWCKTPYITALQSIGSTTGTNTNNVLIQHNPR